MRSTAWFPASATSLVLLLGTAGTMAGQVSDTAAQRPAIVMGEVVDTMGRAIAEAEVVVIRGDSVVIGAATSNPQGHFLLPNLPAGGPYLIMARKVGYQPARRQDMYLKSGDTLRLRLELPPMAVVLDSITVRARQSRYRIAAGDFKVKEYRNALDLLGWKRPHMLGDPEWCPPPDSFGLPRHDRTRVKITDRLLLYTGNKPADASPSRRPWIQAIRFPDPFVEPVSPYVRQLYVNGMRVDVPGDPIRTPLRLLREIRTEHIDQMHYIDCWNTDVPLGMQYSLVVILKPLSRAAQDSVFRTLLAGAGYPVPIDGRELSVKRPSRAVWDSILQLLQTPDSTTSP